MEAAYTLTSPPLTGEGGESSKGGGGKHLVVRTCGKMGPHGSLALSIDQPQDAKHMSDGRFSTDDASPD